MKSAFLRLTKDDAFKAIVLAAIGVAFGTFSEIFSAHRLPTQAELIDTLIICGKMIGAYLFKNLITNDKGELFKK